MTKSSKKSLALIATIAAFLFSNSAFAEPTKVGSKAQTTSIKNVESTNDDPDLKLSIEELRKKYPIGWIKKKYGDYFKGGCEGSSENPQTKAVCMFFLDESNLNSFVRAQPNAKYYRGIDTKSIEEMLNSSFLNPLKDLSESQIKSVIVSQNKYEIEPRSQDILSILLSQLSDPNFSHPLKNKIRHFVNSSNVEESLYLDCMHLSSFDSENELYNTLALNYLNLQHIASDVTLNTEIKNCVSLKKASFVKQVFLKQNPKYQTRN